MEGWNSRHHAAIAAQLGQVWPHLHQFQLAKPALLSAGWESDIYVLGVQAVDEGGVRHAREIVARLYYGEPGASVEPRVGDNLARREFAVLQALADADYPCPRPLWIESPSELWGNAVLWMTRVPGVPMWNRVYHSDEATQHQAHGLFVEMLAALHRLDPHTLQLPGQDAGVPDVELDIPASPSAVMHEVMRLQAMADLLPDVGFGDALAWLAEGTRTVAPGRVGMLHWDFHPENLLWDASNPEFPLHVIDWSGAEVGDTRFDLAWSMVVVGAQEGPGAMQKLLDAYAARVGTQADMEYFLAFACLRRLYVMVVALVHGPMRLGLRAEAHQMIARQLPAAAQLYARWRAAGGPALPQVQQILDGTETDAPPRMAPTG